MSKVPSGGVSSRAESEASPDRLRRRHLIADDQSPSEAVVGAVATAENVDPATLPPLGDHVKADCLDELIGTRPQPAAGGLVFTRTEDISTDVEVSFRYAGHDVTVSDNYVVLE